MLDNRFYIAYRVNVETNLELQVGYILDMYEDRFGVRPEEVLIGPLYSGEQTLIRAGEVWIPIPTKEINDTTYLFATGEDENEENTV